MKVTGDIEFSITEQSGEHIVAVMPVQSGVLNPFGIVHAGAVLWFADVCDTVLSFGKSDTAAGGGGRVIADVTTNHMLTA
jgi:acyl-coenzyme A thioesterase PaaI-like protein